MKKQIDIPTVWVVAEESWGSICGIYSTKELALVALQFFSADSLSKHTISEEPLVGEAAPIDDHPELELDV